MIGTFDWISLGPAQSYVADMRPLSPGGGVSTVWPTTNLAIYVPVPVRRYVTVNALWWNNGTNTGSPTIDMALYNEAGSTRLATVGGATQGASNTLQTTVLGTSVVLAPGVYWLGIVVGNNTTALVAWAGSSPASVPLQKFLGCQQQALGSTVMPSSTTFAAAVNNYVPCIGMWCSTLTM